jgi:hypothetical protein
MTERWKCSAGAEGPPESGRIYCGSVSSLFWCLWNLNFSGLSRTDLGRVPDDEVEDEVQAIRLTRQVVENVLRGSEEVHKVLEHTKNGIIAPLHLSESHLPNLRCPRRFQCHQSPKCPCRLLPLMGEKNHFCLVGHNYATYG